MKELIKIRNSSYILYEELLMRKENLKKEAEQIYIEYLKTFGELLTESFQKKIECIRKKKMIAYCQKCLNQGKEISSIALRETIAAEMKEYEIHLAQLTDSVSAASQSKTLPLRELRQIKEIYYRLARRIHPDMRPAMAEDPIIRDYWNRIVIAYQYNQLSELEEMEVLVNSYLNRTGKDNEEIVIADVVTKTERLQNEIETIISSTPYTYRFLLEDEEKRGEKNESLRKEIQEYETYSAELDEILRGFEIREMYA